MGPTRTAIAIAGLLTMLIGCSQPKEPVSQTNVLLITVDALRADSVSWAGSDFDTTPNLAALAADSVVFDQAITSFPGTTASMPSLMTGLFPNFEGIEEWNKFTYHGFNEFETPEESEQPAISDNLQMLAETLQSHGFRTFGFNTNPNLTQYRKFNQGFTDYDDFGAYMKSARENRQHPLEGAYPPVDVVMAKVLPAIRALQAEPAFMWVHLMESHSPYLPPEPYSRVSSRTFTSLSDLDINGALYHFLHRQWGAKPDQISHPSLEELGISKEELIDHLWGLYEGEIRFCDAELGGMIAAMDELGMLDNTLIIITADHGEEFFDHGFVTHHFESALAEELIRIPLLIRPPGGVEGGIRVGQVVRMVDLAPTILDYVGFPEATATMDGVSLRPLMTGDDLEPLTAYYSTIDYGIVRTERWKYRLEKNRGENGRPVERLYDIVADPMESKDISADHPETLAELRADWVEFTKQLALRGGQALPGSSGDPSGAEVDEATKEQLDALGYLE